ncbi:hypothetical protein HMPREF1624_03660 [Sporothrix schenckii ATCC 58251]|uniref:DUF7704 domain-containing protein n=1 Tax=Sporothrix schenckii (strain ATCC 58251 / de Perez 2211183) TaxID=1391915 RepID=U7PXA6_SPOS1|nr:hypothetical protein HMPREF1624_03660 [Sporothrix schenckii ATCC 58251]
MASTQTSAATAGASPIHWLYRLMLNTLEPFFAFNGALLVFRDPDSYLSTMTRHSIAYPADQGDAAAFLYTQLGGGWLYFAFVEAIVLRLYPNDTRLWRWLCMGMLLSDAAYAHGCAQALGGWAAWADVAQWTGADWMVFWTTAPPLLARLLFVLGLGVDFTSDGATKKQD